MHFLIVLTQLFLVKNIFAFMEDFKRSIEELQTKTPFNTFYELYGLPENSSIASVEERFREISLNENPFPDLKLTKNEINRLVAQGYNILKRNKDKYMKVLDRREFIGSCPDSKNAKILGLFFSIFFAFLISDVSRSLIQFAKGGMKGSIFSNMVVVKTYCGIRRKFRGY